jgi:hypothetical protein
MTDPKSIREVLAGITTPLEPIIEKGTLDVSKVEAGTLLTVPSAPVIGPAGDAPVVAVNTVNRFLDPTFLTAGIGAILAVAEPVIQSLQATGPVNWRMLVLGGLLALVAYLRNRSNTVIK